MSDAYLTIGRDLPTHDQPWRRTSGAELVSQNVREALLTPIGSLPWAREDGSILTRFRNDSVNPGEVIAEIERVALTVPGVVPASVLATHNPQTDTYVLAFQGPAGEPITLDVSI